MTRQVETLDHVWFWVRDMDRAVAFYGESLGLPMRMRHGDDWAEFDSGGARIGLHGAGEHEGEIPHGGTAVFVVEDLDLVKAALSERGVTFEEHLGEVPGYARYASFADPDGNSMQVIEYLGDSGSSSEAVAPDHRSAERTGDRSR